MLLLLLVRSDPEKIRDLEDEQEELNGSLLALTSHFAQVHGCIFYYCYFFLWRRMCNLFKWSVQAWSFQNL